MLRMEDKGLFWYIRNLGKYMYLTVISGLILFVDQPLEEKKHTHKAST